MTKEQCKNLFFDILVDAASGLLIGVALYNFAADALFPLTGLSGIAMIFYQFWGWKIGITTMLLNIPLIIGAYKTLGKKFMFKSFKSMIIGTIMMDFVTPIFPVVNINDTLLNAIVVAVLTGIGYAIVYMRNSSTGGADFMMMLIKAKKPHMSLGMIFFIVDVVVIILDTVTYARSIEGMLYGFIISYGGSVVVDKLMVTADSGMMCMVVTTKPKEVAAAIDAAVERGTTIFSARGGFTGEDRPVVMCACSNKEMYQINRVVKKIDVNAFTVIMESKEVYGEGFKRFKG